MSHPAVLRVLAVAVASLVACEAPPTDTTPPDAGRASPLHVVAATPVGLARIDARTWNVLQSWGTRPVLDVAPDPHRREVVSFEVDPREEGGWVVAHDRVVGETARWFVDGDVRLLPTAVGLLSLERSYGERWRLLRASPAASWPAPRPSSLVLGDDGSVVFAVTDGGAVLRAVALGPPLHALDDTPLSPALHPTAQLLDRDHALDVVDGALALRTLDRGRVRTDRRHAVQARSILAARRDGARIVALVDGPLQLVLLAGDRAATLPLPGEPCGGAIECRALVVAPPHVVVGTRDALHLARMSADLRLDLEGSTTAAHGPVAGPEP